MLSHFGYFPHLNFFGLIVFSFVVVGCWLLVVGWWLLVVGCWLLVGGWLLVAGGWSNRY